MKAFATCILLGTFAIPVFAADAATAPNTKDLMSLKQLVEAQGVSTSQTAPKGIVLNGYVSTSYTKQLSGPLTCTNGSNVVATPKNGGNLTTEKLSVNLPLSEKNEWSAGFQVDAIHCSSK